MMKGWLSSTLKQSYCHTETGLYDLFDKLAVVCNALEFHKFCINSRPFPLTCWVHSMPLCRSWHRGAPQQNCRESVAETSNICQTYWRRQQSLFAATLVSVGSDAWVCLGLHGPAEAPSSLWHLPAQLNLCWIFNTIYFFSSAAAVILLTTVAEVFQWRYGDVTKQPSVVRISGLTRLW